MDARSVAYEVGNQHELPYLAAANFVWAWMAVKALRVLSAKFRNDTRDQTFAADIWIISLCGLNWLLDRSPMHVSP